MIMNVYTVITLDGKRLTAYGATKTAALRSLMPDIMPVDVQSVTLLRRGVA